jgi:copper oxidase (laccase) domain-containing protein
MERLGARREHIRAAIGPCIAQPSYEVDEAFQARFLDADAANARFFIEGGAGRLHFALEPYIAARLDAAGIAGFDAIGLDTYSDPARFYSYRRATHRGEPDYGRQVSLIGLPAKSA